MKTSLNKTVSRNSESGSDISDMTKSELLSYAEEHGIEGVSGDMKKAEIIEVIENSA